MTKLYILGNGFDLHHRLASRYSDFRDFVSENNATLSVFMHSQDFDWNDFEEGLGDADWDQITDAARDNLSEYIQEIGADFVLEEAIENLLDHYSISLPQAFSNWASTLGTDFDNNHSPQFSFSRNDYFLSFNYTDTLERRYHIDPRQILYIHGRAGNSEIITGHSGRYFSTQAQHKDDLPMVSQYADDTMKAYLDKTKKPTEATLSKYQPWFFDASKFKDVYVFGHSLNSIDLPYFYEIRKYNPNLNWHFSFFCKQGLATIKYFIETANLPAEQVKSISPLADFEAHRG